MSLTKLQLYLVVLCITLVQVTLCSGSGIADDGIALRDDEFVTAPALGRYGADSSKVSVSGLSSGAFMAVQIHVAYSKSIMGVGVVAGGPFYCAQANLQNAIDDCMVAPHKINVAYLEQITRNTVFTGTIDGTSNLDGDMVYLFGGRVDSTVDQGVVIKLEDYYRRFITTNTIHAEYSIDAEHAFITDNYGGLCPYNGKPYINNCDYHQAYEILNHVYGGHLKKPSSTEELLGAFKEFDQSEFLPFNNPSKYSMDSIGYVYIPSQCDSSISNCPVHVAIHGCHQGRITLQDEYARHTGYNEVAELNNIIIVYPQAIPSLLINPNGCWDWWGYTGLNYASNQAPQMRAIKAMVDRILS